MIVTLFEGTTAYVRESDVTTIQEWVWEKPVYKTRRVKFLWFWRKSVSVLVRFDKVTGRQIWIRDGRSIIVLDTLLALKRVLK